MLRTPSICDVNAKGVGRQTWNVLLKRRRKSFVGAQWSGRDGVKAKVLSHCMVLSKNAA